MGLGRKFLLPNSASGGVPVSLTYWVIAGGGGAGDDNYWGTAYSGGGAGGVLTSTVSVPAGETIAISAVGFGGAPNTTRNLRGNQGGNTVVSSTTLGTLTSIGGGGGGSRSYQSGGNGGSGGGGSWSAAGGTGTSGQGFNGGNGQGTNWGSGGGGASAAGSGINGGAGITITYANSASTVRTGMIAFGGGSRMGVSPYSLGTDGDGTSTGTNNANASPPQANYFYGSGASGALRGGYDGAVILKVDETTPISNDSGYTYKVNSSGYDYYTFLSTANITM